MTAKIQGQKLRLRQSIIGNERAELSQTVRICVKDRDMAGLVYAAAVMASFSGININFIEDENSYDLIILNSKEFREGAYEISITATNGRIICDGYTGGINAVADLINMIVFRNNAYSVPVCEIYDFPDSRFRSLLLDPARKHIPLQDLKDIAVTMAKCKMNKIHLHLSDSGYYSIQSEKLPELNNNHYTKYTLDDMREFVRFASVLGIDVIPEIEMPAHAQFFVEHIPGLKCLTGSHGFDTPDKSSTWVMCASSEDTYEAIDKIMEELTTVFKYPYIHIGTDELMFRDLTDLGYWPEWENCSRCRQLCRENGIGDITGLFYYFIRRVHAIATKYDRKLIMWNDGIDISRSPDLPRDILIQFWRIAMKHRGPYEGCSMERFLEEGFTVINSYYPQTYIDLYMTEKELSVWDPTTDPPSSPELHHMIIGSEMCAWEGKAHFERTIPAGLTAFAYKLWDHTSKGFGEEFREYQSRVLLGAGCPEGFRLSDFWGTAFLPLDDNRYGELKNIKLTDAEFSNGITVLEGLCSGEHSTKYAGVYLKVLKKIREDRKELKVMTYTEFLDKVEGCWFGKNLGGAGGVAKEGVKERIRGVDFKDIINTELPNDDLDLQIMWLQTLEDRGPYLDTAYMASLWKAACKYPWSEYGYFMKNYNRGILPPVSGWFNNEFFLDGMGCPIRSEIWAVAYAGIPQLALEKAKMDGSIDHAGNSMWGEAFLAALESMLFVNTEHIEAIKTAAGMIDQDTKIYKCIMDIVRNYENGSSFEKNFDHVMANYSHPDFTNSIQNIAIAILAVLYGDLDMDKTINLALSCGYDADCTCATAGAIVGIIKGISAIPQYLKDLINDRYVIGVDIKRPNNSIHTFAEDCARISLGMQKHHNSEKFFVTDIPGTVTVPKWEMQMGTVLSLTYKDLPAIGSEDECRIAVEVDNTSSGEPVSGFIRIDGLPDGWQVKDGEISCDVSAYGTKTYETVVFTGKLETIKQTNILKAALTDKRTGTVIAEAGFGIAGKAPFRLYGPFFGTPNWRHNPDWPHCHGGANLPPIVAMVHNEVHLDYECCDEELLKSDPASYTENLIGTTYAAEDVVPIQEHTGISGECGFILVQDVIMPEDCEGWIVIGNTDAFKIDLNGEEVLRIDQNIFWTPINNAVLCKFKKGVNRIMIKLLRRTDSVKFSMGIKEYKNKHYHQVFWRDDLTYKII